MQCNQIGLFSIRMNGLSSFYEKLHLVSTMLARWQPCEYSSPLLLTVRTHTGDNYTSTSFWSDRFIEPTGRAKDLTGGTSRSPRQEWLPAQHRATKQHCKFMMWNIPLQSPAFGQRKDNHGRWLTMQHFNWSSCLYIHRIEVNWKLLGSAF